MPEFDVVGVGLNATDTLLIVPHFPAYAGKVPFQEEVVSPGGQVASALVYDFGPTPSAATVFASVQTNLSGLLTAVPGLS